MKFHCNRCGKDFTTLSERDKSRKFAFTHLILDKMKCPNCGASNYHLLPRTRGKKRSGGRGYGVGWNSNDDRPEPNIILHPDCQKRISGNPMNISGLEVHCDGCKSFFNCWTGNVDDGLYNAPLTESIEEQRKKATITIKKRDDELEQLTELRKRMGKVGFGYQFYKEMWYAKFGGTVWKLTDNDIQAICNNVWDTPQTIIIKRTFYNKEIKLIVAHRLFMLETLIRERGLDI